MFLAFGKPEALNLSNATSSTLQISWSFPDVGGNAQLITGYVLRWNPENNDGSGGEKTVPHNFTTISNLSSNMKYFISVAVCDAIRGQDGEISDPFEAITCKFDRFQSLSANLISFLI